VDLTKDVLKLVEKYMRQSADLWADQTEEHDTFEDAADALADAIDLLEQIHDV
jgi:hypothetical protein